MSPFGEPCSRHCASALFRSSAENPAAVSLAAGVKMSAFRGLQDVYVNLVMPKKCQNKQLVLHLTAKGTAGESPPRHHDACPGLPLRQAQPLSGTLAAPAHDSDRWSYNAVRASFRQNRSTGPRARAHPARRRRWAALGAWKRLDERFKCSCHGMI